MNILDLLFPKKCLECGSKGLYICPKCLDLVPKGFKSNLNYSVFKYKGVIRKAIIALKYKFASDLVFELTNILAREVNFNYDGFILVPIPLSRNRLNFRGFNQTELIAKELANKLGIKFIPDLILKTKETKHQVGLKGVERRQNLVNSFVFNTKYEVDKNQKILLFDDVYTTGTTIKEAERTLFVSGYENIFSLTIAC